MPWADMTKPQANIAIATAMVHAAAIGDATPVVWMNANWVSGPTTRNVTSSAVATCRRQDQDFIAPQSRSRLGASQAGAVHRGFAG